MAVCIDDFHDLLIFSTTGDVHLLTRIESVMVFYDKLLFAVLRTSSELLEPRLPFVMLNKILYSDSVGIYDLWAEIRSFYPTENVPSMSAARTTIRVQHIDMFTQSQASILCILGAINQSDSILSVSREFVCVFLRMRRFELWFRIGDKIKIRIYYMYSAQIYMNIHIHIHSSHIRKPHADVPVE